MDVLIKYLVRPTLVVVALLGLSCYLAPQALSVISWSWQGGFIIAMVPASIVLFIDGSIGALQASIRARG